VSKVLEYADPNPETKRGRVRIALMQLYEEHRRAGMLPTSGRFLFYELVARGVINKSGVRPDQIVTKALTDLRKRGLIPWEHIVDETRDLSDYTGSATVADDLLLHLRAARIDPWDGEAPLILTESRSLAGVLRALCGEYRIRISSTNGQVGGFLYTDIAPVLTERDRVGYLGDFDLSGGMIEDNTREVLESEVGVLAWRRLALTEEQVHEYHLPSITKTDKRFKGAGGTHEAVETSASCANGWTANYAGRLPRLLKPKKNSVSACGD
jgi:hypothetical protein